MNEKLHPRRPTATATPASCPGRAGNKPVVVALHCSGADGNQWRRLAAMLTPDFAVVTPDLIGANGSAPWHGRRAFTLADEAERILSSIGSRELPLHLVGHSYGGGVALRIAAANPTRIASLSLYEPSAFHLLRELGSGAASELAEIEELSRAVLQGVGTGAYAEAAETFVDYWNGGGTWSALRDDVRAAMLRWIPYAVPQFHALLSETTPLAAFRLHCPVLVLRGEQARPPSRLLADAVAAAVSDRPAESIAGAGHMGPITHAYAVNACIAAHVAAAEAALTVSRRPSRNAA